MFSRRSLDAESTVVLTGQLLAVFLHAGAVQFLDEGLPVFGGQLTVALEELHDFLAIVVDTSNEKRIDDKSYQLAKEIISLEGE